MIYIMSTELYSHLTPVATGQWGPDTTWELYATDVEPPEELCTGVFCLPITETGDAVLMQARRGWGMVGGHIDMTSNEGGERRETIAEALMRESLEECGYPSENPRLYAVRQIHNTSDGRYPPVGYLPYYLTDARGEPAAPTGHEVLGVGGFSRTDVITMRWYGRPLEDSVVIELGFRALENE